MSWSSSSRHNAGSGRVRREYRGGVSPGAELACRVTTWKAEQSGKKMVRSRGSYSEVDDWLRTCVPGNQRCTTPLLRGQRQITPTKRRRNKEGWTGKQTLETQGNMNSLRGTVTPHMRVGVSVTENGMWYFCLVSDWNDRDINSHDKSCWDSPNEHGRSSDVSYLISFSTGLIEPSLPCSAIPWFLTTAVLNLKHDCKCRSDLYLQKPWTIKCGTQQSPPVTPARRRRTAAADQGSKRLSLSNQTISIHRGGSG